METRGGVSTCRWGHEVRDLFMERGVSSRCSVERMGEGLKGWEEEEVPSGRLRSRRAGLV